MRLRNMPNMTRLLAQFALGLLALLCVLYAFYIAFLMPPLVKYGTAGGRADGRAVCAAVGRRADERYRADFHPENSNTGKYGSLFSAVYIAAVDRAAKDAARKASADCLSETAVNTPLLVLRVAVLLIIGAVFALLASRLKTA